MFVDTDFCGVAWMKRAGENGFVKIGYARVSTGEQNTAAQLDALRAAGCDRIIEETVSTRAHLPLRDAMLAELVEGDQLIVWRIDRLARNTRDLLNLIADLEARGIHLASVTEPIDTQTASGRALFRINSVFAELEREVLSERTKAGMAARKRAGVHVGRPRALTPSQIDHAAELMKAAGASLRAVAASFNVSHSTLRNALDRRNKARTV